MILDDNVVSKLMSRISEIEANGIKTDYILDNRVVPRVTEILSSMLHNDGLMHWSNSLGWKRISYSAFMREAADKGTYSHLAIEKFIKQGYINIDEMNLPNNNIKETVCSCVDAFSQWWNKLNNEHLEVKTVYIEETLIHPYFGGTCDCLLMVDGQYWLIDFKTSNHMNYSYALQLAAYRFLLRELKGINIDKAMVLRLDKVDHCYYTYELDMCNPNHKSFIENCEQTFMMLTAAFKMRISTTEEYHNIFELKHNKG